MVLRYLLPLVFLVGCMPPEADGFGGSGSKNSNSGSTDPDDTDDETQDSGEEDTDDPLDDRPDGWPEPLDPNGASINDLQGKFDEYPNMGTVVEVSFGFWDGQSDVQGGTVVATVSDGRDMEGEEIQAEISASRSNSYSWVDGDRVVFVLDDVYETRSYEFVVMVVDRRDNRSNILEGTVSQ